MPKLSEVKTIKRVISAPDTRADDRARPDTTAGGGRTPRHGGILPETGRTDGIRFGALGKIPAFPADARRLRNSSPVADRLPAAPCRNAGREAHPPDPSVQQRQGATLFGYASVRTFLGCSKTGKPILTAASQSWARSRSTRTFSQTTCAPSWEGGKDRQGMPDEPGIHRRHRQYLCGRDPIRGAHRTRARCKQPDQRGVGAAVDRHPGRARLLYRKKTRPRPRNT